MNCPHCHKPISASQIASALARSGSKAAGRPKTLKPCPKCGQRFGARELRKHQAVCASTSLRLQAFTVDGELAADEVSWPSSIGAAESGYRGWIGCDLGRGVIAKYKILNSNGDVVYEF